MGKSTQNRPPSLSTVICKLNLTAARTELGMFVDGVYVLQADVHLTAVLVGSNCYIRLTAGTNTCFSSEREFGNFEVATGRASAAVPLPGGVAVCFAKYVLGSLSAAVTAYRIAFHCLVWHPRVKS